MSSSLNDKIRRWNFIRNQMREFEKEEKELRKDIARVMDSNQVNALESNDYRVFRRRYQKVFINTRRMPANIKRQYGDEKEITNYYIRCK